MAKPAATPELSRPTRERILDVALDLFVEQGYEAASLREIAERMGFTKAALYYHFPSKEDILFALHLRLHALMDSALGDFGGGPTSMDEWSLALQGMLELVLANRQLLLLHVRDGKSVGAVQTRHEHEEDHPDLEINIRRSLADPALTTRDRVRLAASFGALFAGIALSGDALADVPDDQLADVLRGVLRDVLGPEAPRA